MTDKLNDNELEQINGGTGETTIEYPVLHGETLENIAWRYNTTVEMILRYNPNIVKDRSSFCIGCTIIVPLGWKT